MMALSPTCCSGLCSSRSPLSRPLSGGASRLFLRSSHRHGRRRGHGFRAPSPLLPTPAASSTSPRPPGGDDWDPQSEPPPPDLLKTLNKFQDGVQIFFTVFFWMALFFWLGAWDGRGKGRSDKSSRFRRYYMLALLSELLHENKGFEIENFQRQYC